MVGVADAEALFTSTDPKLHRNKQAAYHIVKELLECNYWHEADKYLTERYIQHNPQAAKAARQWWISSPRSWAASLASCPAKMTTKVVSVVAEGDYVYRHFSAGDEGSQGRHQDLHHQLV